MAEKEKLQMRQYRGKSKDKDERWIYGWYSYNSKRNIHMITEDNNGTWEVIPETVGQSIVVDGKEFYEGDVTKDYFGDLGIVRFGKLPLGKSGDCVCTYPAFYIQCLGQLGQAPTWECQEIGEWMEVIGTIHTHPELM